MKSAYWVAAATVCLAGQVEAGETVLYGAAPKWVEPAPTPTAKDAKSPVVLFDIQQRLEDGMLATHIDQALWLNSPQALTQGGTTGAQWMPDKGDLTINRVAILRGDKEIDVLDGGARYTVLRRESNLERRMLNGMLTATMPVPGLQMGDILRVSYTVTARDPALDGNIQTSIPLMAEPAAAGFGRARISWPEGAPVHWLAGPRIEGLEEQGAGGYRSVTVDLPVAKPDEMPDDAPSRYRRLPLLQAGTFADWQEVSSLFAPLYDPQGTIAVGSALEREVKAIAGESDDPLVRAAKATHLVQDKIGYLMNGMSGGNYRPQSPAETWESRFGDCKAKTLLLLALLDRLGVEAEAVLVNTQMSDATGQLLPMPGAFDHVLVRAIIDGKSYWLDGTSAGTRLENLADTPPFRTVLPLRADGAGLMTLDPRVPAKPATVIDLVIDQRAGVEVPAIVSADIRFTGPLADQLSAAYKSMTPDQVDDTIETFAQQVAGEIYLADGDVAFDAPSATATITFKGMMTSGWRQEGTRLRRKLDELESANLEFSPNRARSAWKDIPVELGGPEYTVTTIRYMLPGDNEAFEMAGMGDADATYAGRHLTRTVSRSGSQITVVEKVETTGGELPANLIGEEKRKVASMVNSTPSLTAPADTLRVWQYATKDKRKLLQPVEAVYQGAIDRSDDDAQSWRNRAGFRSGVADYRGAISDYDRAIELEPDADLYLERGRTYGALDDSEKEIADHRMAFELEPTAQHATMLAYTLGIAGRTDEALELLDQFDASGDDRNGIIETRADLLGRAGRSDEGLAQIEDLIAEQPGQAYLLNSECWYRARFKTGLDDIVDVCNRAVERAPSASAALDSRALAWMQVGQPAKAKADAEAALTMNPSMMVTRYVLAHADRALGNDSGQGFIDYFTKTWPRLTKEYERYGLKP